ncbi:MAG: hypothetical protein J6C23_00680 [Clostridia bacterium]|nr:hypothetical protein [Clostridia bacterium]
MRKFKQLLLGVLVVCLLVISAVFVMPTKAHALDVKINEVGITDYQTPIVGEMPDLDIGTTDDSYSIESVQWKAYTGDVLKNISGTVPFMAMGRYVVEIVVKAEEGYTFAVSGLDIRINNSKIYSGYMYGEGETLIIRQEYQLESKILHVGIQDLALPVAGQLPDTQVSVDSPALYQVDKVSWFDEDGNEWDNANPFWANMAYSVKIDLSAKDGYIFETEDGIKAYVSGSWVYGNAKAERSEYGKKLSVVQQFEAIPPAKLDSIVVTVTEPKAGFKPDYENVEVEGNAKVLSINDSVYTNGIAWYDNETGVRVGENDKFEANKEYYCVVALQADSDYLFDDFNAGQKYNVNGKYTEITTQLSAQQARLKGYFTVGDSIDLIQIGGVTVPVAGEKPVYSATVYNSDFVVDKISWGVNKTVGSSDKIVELGENEVFQKDEYYYFSVTVKNNGATPISGNVKATINNNSAITYNTNVSDGNDNWTTLDPTVYKNIECWFYCSGEVIETVEIGDLILPEAGQKPSYNVSVGSTGYITKGEAFDTDLQNGQIVDIYYVKNGIGWYDVTAEKYVYENEEFIGGHTYEVTISLETQNDCKFLTNSNFDILTTGTLNGEEATMIEGSVSNVNYYLKMKKSFVCPKVAINQVRVSIQEPRYGYAPDWTKIDNYAFESITNNNMDETIVKNGISWFVGEDAIEIASDYKFLENTEYKVCIYLTFKEGYYIESAESVEVYVNGLIMDETNLMIFPAEPSTVFIYYTFDTTGCDCDLEPVAEVPATCTEEGTRAHFKCSKCNTMYKDANGEELLDEGEPWLVIEPHHSFGNWTKVEGADDIHMGVCKCGEEGYAECEYEAIFVAGPSQYAKKDATVYMCKVCKNVSSVIVQSEICDHELSGWTHDKKFTDRHYRSCECGMYHEEAACESVMTIVKFPSKYSDVRNVYLYTCRVCGGEYFLPIEGEIPAEEEIKDVENNITIAPQPESGAVLPEGTTISVEKIDNISSEAKDNIEKEVDGTVEYVGGYDIALMVGDVNFNPNANVCVTVYFPGLNVEMADDYKMFYVDDSDKCTEVEMFVSDDGTVSFITDHFSKYVIVKVTPKTEEPPAPSKPSGGCGANAMEVLSLIAGLVAVAFIFKKK